MIIYRYENAVYSIVYKKGCGLKMRTSPIIVNEIRRLSQEEGLTDSEIAEIIQYNHVSIQRIRKDNEIPTYNREKRKLRNGGV